MLLVTYLHTVSEMRPIRDIRNWTIANQIFLGMSVRSVINIRFNKVEKCLMNLNFLFSLLVFLYLFFSSEAKKVNKAESLFT